MNRLVSASLRRTLARWFSPTKTLPIRRAAASGSRRSLSLETLEDRATPAVFTVTNADDTGAGSFRQALTDSVAATTADSIVFDSAFFASAQTISLGSVLPQITAGSGNLTIAGTGASKLTIQRDPAAATNFRIFNSLSPNLTMTGFTVKGGNVAGDGGGLLASGSVTLDGMVFTGNTPTLNGGAIRMNTGGFLALRNSTLSGNAAGNNGGGIYCYYNGSLLMENSTISGNSAGATAANRGGGGLYFYGTPSAAPPAGFTASTLVIRNSTIANNTSGSSGGGVQLTAFSGALLVQNSTITGNSAGNTAANQGGGGIARTSGSGIVNIANSVVQGNTNANGPDILSGGTVNVNYSAVGDNTGFTLSGASGNNIAFGTDLKLAALGDYGGPTKTRVPLNVSPLVNFGSSALAPAGLFDQRGFGYFREFGGFVDIGSAEFQPPGLPLALATTTGITTANAGEVSYSFTVTYADPTGGMNGIRAIDLIGNNNAVRVTGPGGYDVPAQYVSIDVAGDGTPRTVTYKITPPVAPGTASTTAITKSTCRPIRSAT